MSIKPEKIGLIDTALHFEVLRTYAMIFTHLDIKLCCVLKKSSYQLMSDFPNKENIEWHFLEADNVASILPKLTDCDLLVFITFKQSISPFLSLSIPKYAVIHSAYRHFAPWQHLDFKKNPLRSLVNLGRSLINPPFPSHTQLDGVIVGAPNIFTHIHNASFFEKDFFFQFSFYVYEKPDYHKSLDSKTLRIVIPGTIHPNSRDYKLVLSVFKEIDFKGQSVSLYFAGKAAGSAGQQIVSAFKKIASKNLNIFTYDHFLSAKEYEELILAADILLCPIPKHTIIGFVKELNSYSQVSGNINDFISKGKRVILPSYYQVEPELEPAIYRYEHQKELVNLITKLINTPLIEPIDQTIFDAFGIKAQSKLFEKELIRLWQSAPKRD